jgi:hypothetical protein
MCRWCIAVVRTRRGDPEEGTEMKKMFVIAAAFVVALIALRRFGPALAKRAMAKCEEMMGARFVDSRTSTEESAARVAV